MKRLLWLLALLPAIAFGQAAGPYGIFGGPISSTSLPPATTTAGAANTYAFTSDLGLLESNGTAWVGAAGGGARTFDQLGSGDNTTATMTVDTGASLSFIGSGTIAATSALALAATPAQCAGGQFATGISASGAANCGTPAGSGNVSTSGTITSGNLPLWNGATTLTGSTAVGSNTFVGNNGSGIAALTAAQAIGVLNSASANAQTGTTYTLVLGDANGQVTMNNSSANTLTIPTHATVAIPVGSIVTVEQLGAGVTSVTPATGVTIQSPQFGSSSTQAYPLGGIYGNVQLIQTATDTWFVVTYNPGAGTAAFSGTCTNSSNTANASRGKLTMSSAGNCTIIITPGGMLPSAHGFTGTMCDRTQPTVPCWGATADSTTTITFTVPTAVASSDVVAWQMGPY